MTTKKNIEKAIKLLNSAAIPKPKLIFFYQKLIEGK